MSKTPQRPVSGDPVPSGWFGELFDWIEASAAEITLLRRIVGQLQARRPVVRTAAGDTDYSGPFAVTVNPANTAQVLIGAARAEDGYAWLDSIRVGARLITKTVAEAVTVTANGYTYYDIDNTAPATPAATAAFAAAIPENTAAHIYRELAKVSLTDGVAAVVGQKQFGQIYVLFFASASAQQGPPGVQGSGYGGTSSTSDTIGI